MHTQNLATGLNRRLFPVGIALLTAALFLLSGQAARAATGSVIGKITEPNGTTAVASANLTLRTSNWSYSAYKPSGSDGTFVFLDVPAGSYQLDISTSSTTTFAPDSVSLTVSDNQTTNLSAVKLLNPNFFCKVVRSDGTTPITSASLTIRTSDWTISRYAQTDSSGNCKMAIQRQNTYVVEVYSNDTIESRPDNFTFTFSGASVYYDGTNGSSVIKTIPPAVRGTIKLPDGTAPSYANLSLYDSNNTAVQWASTDTSGNFKLDAVASGTYVLKISPPYTPAGLASPADITLQLTKGVVNTTYLTTPITLGYSAKTITVKVTRASTGAAITDAQVSAWKRDGNGSASGSVNSAGEASFKVSSGGTWEFSVYPSYSSSSAVPNWTYDGPQKTATFSLPNSDAETVAVNFSVATLSAVLKGRVTLPDGSSPSTNDYYSISAWRERGNGGYSQLGANGTYQMNLAPGTYNVSVYGSTVYGAAQMTITLGDKETYTLDFKLLDRNAKITGAVRDNNGHGIANQYCNAWIKNGSGWGNATTDTNGTYTMNVTAGTWFVSCYPSSGSQATSLARIQSTSTSYVSTDPPQEVSVKENGTVNADFTFAIASATLSGKVVGSNGDTLTNLYGWVEAKKCRGSSAGPAATFGYGGLGGSITTGTFTLRVPEGCWRLSAYLPYGGDYTSSTATSKEITVAVGATISTIELKVAESNATVSGSFVDKDGRVLTDVYGSVSLTNGAAYQWAQVTAGKYTLKTSADSWDFGCWVDPATAAQYYLNGTCEGTVVTKANETTTKNIKLLEADSQVTVKAVDPKGDPLPNVLVTVSTSFGATKTVSYSTYGAWFNPDKYTNQKGVATLSVPQGTYFVSGSLARDLGYINPDRQVVTVSKDTPTTVTLEFRKPDAVILGTVKHNGAAYTGGAVVTGWSPNGGFTETTTDAEGKFSLPATKDKWTVSAGADDSPTLGLQSAETTVTVPETGKATATIDLDSSTALAKGVTTTVATNIQGSLSQDSGATFSAPANVLSPTNINVTISITATTEEVPPLATDAPVGPAYTIDAIQSSGNNAGKQVSQLSGSATVVLPYSDDQLTALGLNESDLTMKAWDPTASTYTDLQTVTVDQTANTVTGTTNHLSKFVITTAPVEKKTAPTTGGGNTGGGNSGGGNTGGGGSTTETPTITPDLVELATHDLVVLTGGQGPTIAVYSPAGTLVKKFRPYGLKAQGSFHLLATKLTGTDEQLVVWDSSGRGLPVKIFSLAGSELSKLSTGSGQRVMLTPADLDGSGKRELILSSTNSPTVIVYAYSKGTPKRILSLPENRAGAGVEVLAGNFAGADDTDEIAVVPYGGNTISVFGVNLKKKIASPLASATGLTLADSGKRVLTADVRDDAKKEFLLPPTNGTGLVRVLGVSKEKLQLLTTATVDHALAMTTGDLDSDGKANVIALVSSAGQPSLRVLSFKKGAVSAQSQMSAFSLPKDSSFDTLAVGDFDANGSADVVVTDSNSSRVMAFTYQAKKNLLKTLTTAYVGGKKAANGFGVLAADLTGNGRQRIILVPTGNSPTLTIMKLQRGKLVTENKIRPAGDAFRGTFAVAQAAN